MYLDKSKHCSSLILPPWRTPLARAIHRNQAKPYSRYFQLATVTPDGYPSNRTVVFRGFGEDDRSSLKIITDRRSQKAQQIQHQTQPPKHQTQHQAIGAICWYFTKTREQFRIQGDLQLVTSEEQDLNLLKIRQITWQSLSDGSRSQFAWPTPGQPVADQSAFEVDLPDPNQPLDNFCLLLLTPQTVDHLQLKPNPQQRCLYRLQPDQTWLIQPINP